MMRHSDTQITRAQDIYWKVYRIQTCSSTYLLGVYDDGIKRQAILKGYSWSIHEYITAADTAPLLDDEPLFSLSREQWEGRCLQVANVSTSPIVAVERDHDPRTIPALVRIQGANALGNARWR
jgi:hypothetical protein